MKMSRWASIRRVWDQDSGESYRHDSMSSAEFRNLSQRHKDEGKQTCDVPSGRLATIVATVLAWQILAVAWNWLPVCREIDLGQMSAEIREKELKFTHNITGSSSRRTPGLPLSPNRLIFLTICDWYPLCYSSVLKRDSNVVSFFSIPWTKWYFESE